jgi:hypothetical protein
MARHAAGITIDISFSELSVPVQMPTARWSKYYFMAGWSARGDQARYGQYIGAGWSFLIKKDMPPGTSFAIISAR